MDIGEKIKKLRNDKKMTQSQLAELCGISRNALINYEQDKRKPNIEILSKISKNLNVSISFFNTDEKINFTEFDNGVKAFGIGEMITFSEMVNSLHDPFMGRSKEEIINMCEYASKILLASNIKITCVKDKDFDYLIHVMNYDTGKATYIQYNQFFVEADKITWFMRNEINTIMEAE